jgi:hypothetical protein
MDAPGPCPFCAFPKTVKRGIRQTRNGPVQIFHCRRCDRRFSLAPLPDYSFPPAAVLAAPADFYLGYSIREIQARTQRRFGRLPSPATVLQWVREFGKYAAVKALRPGLQAFDRPGRIIAGRFFHFPERHLFQVHRYKLEQITGSQPALGKYLNRLLDNNFKIDCRTFDPGLTLGLELAAPPNRKNYACAVAALAAKAAETDVRRQAALQRFMLATDKATVATGVPVFMSNGETRTVLHRNGGWLGQIGFLQAFGDVVAILEYVPPGEETGNIPGQLLLCALALSQRTGIHLKRIMCAWFSEEWYRSFTAMEGYGEIRR